MVVGGAPPQDWVTAPVTFPVLSTLKAAAMPVQVWPPLFTAVQLAMAPSAFSKSVPHSYPGEFVDARPSEFTSPHPRTFCEMC